MLTNKLLQSRMIRNRILTAGPLVATVVSVMATPFDGHAKETRPDIPVSQMMSFCRGEAASALQLSPRDISTLPVERSGSNYRVYGQSPAAGDNALFFTCEFNKHREFDKVTKTSDKRSKETRPNIPESQMMSFCRGEAASAFQLSPRNISTLPVERSGSNYRVYGQSPAAGDNALFFTCEFNKNREFDKVTKTSDKRSSDSDNSSGEVVSLADMPNFCKGMAAEKFQQSPRRISTNKPAIQSDGSYKVFGQYDRSDNEIQAFSCKFSPQKRFVNVHNKR